MLWINRSRVKAASRAVDFKAVRQKRGGQILSVAKFYNTRLGKRYCIAEWGTNRLWLMLDGRLFLQGANDIVYEVSCSAEDLKALFAEHGYSPD